MRANQIKKKELLLRRRQQAIMLMLILKANLAIFSREIKVKLNQSKINQMKLERTGTNMCK